MNFLYDQACGLNVCNCFWPGEYMNGQSSLLLRSHGQGDAFRVGEHPHALMPNAIQIYGLQHFVHNLTQDVHKALNYFDDYYTHLTTLSKLLSVEGRRTRFIVHCVNTSPYASEAWKFKKFRGHLYSKRWKEVTKYSKSVIRVIWLLGECWDQQKYLQGAGNAAQEEPDGSEPLDVTKITSVVHDHFFRRYLILIVTGDSIPEENIASWGSGCPCHEELRQWHDMSEHMFAKMMESHYGDGMCICMLSGCRAAELAAGKIKVLLLCIFGVLGLCHRDIERLPLDPLLIHF